MRYLAIAFLIAACPAYGQSVSVPDQEVMKLRQAIADKYAVAISNKNIAAAVAEVFTADAVLQSLCPESPLAFGREAYAKRLEDALKSGFRDYSAKVKEAHVLSDGRAWTTGTYTFVVNGKDGKSEQAQGNWIDMLRREGNEWKVMFQAYARTPC